MVWVQTSGWQVSWRKTCSLKKGRGDGSGVIPFVFAPIPTQPQVAPPSAAAAAVNGSDDAGGAAGEGEGGDIKNIKVRNDVVGRDGGRGRVMLDIGTVRVLLRHVSYPHGGKGGNGGRIKWVRSLGASGSDTHDTCCMLHIPEGPDWKRRYTYI